MENYTQKGTLLLNCIAPRQQCTMLSSNLMLMACFMTQKGLVINGRQCPGKTEDNETDSFALIKESSTGLNSHRLVQKPHLTPLMKKILPDIIAIRLSLNGRKFCFLMNAAVCTSHHAY